LKMSNENPFSSFSSQMSFAFSSLKSSLKPISSEVSKTILQASQYAKEQISSQDITDLPAEYKQLEERVDRIKQMHELMLKVSRNYGLEGYDYEPGTIDKMTGFASVVGQNAQSLAEKLAANTSSSAASPTGNSIGNPIGNSTANPIGNSALIPQTTNL
jgi:Bin/amphiphysin/Rvs domain for vesicular trafficking